MLPIELKTLFSAMQLILLLKGQERVISKQNACYYQLYPDEALLILGVRSVICQLLFYIVDQSAWPQLKDSAVLCLSSCRSASSSIYPSLLF